MVTRQDFMKCCALGVCSAFLPEPAIASATDDAGDLQWKLDASRVRYAKFIQIVKSGTDDVGYKRLLQSLGRECAMQHRSRTFDKYKGNIKGFLAAIQGPSGWVAEAQYDEAKGTIRIVDRASTCTCPLVEQGVTPADQCDCTLGWQEETYSRILERPVKAELEESILRGGKRCVFRIRAV